MLSAFFGLVALALAGLLAFVTRLSVRTRTPQLLAHILVLAALVWDNTIIAIGRLLGPGPLLEDLSVPRYVTHALFTPLMLLLGLFLATRLGVVWCGRRWVRVTAIILTAAMIGLGVYTEVVRLELEAEQYADTLRYANAASMGPPIPSIVTILVLIVVGISIWVKAKWPWLAVGAIVMFVAAAVGVTLVSVQNVGELALMTGLALTARKATAPVRPTPELTDRRVTAADRPV